MQCYESLALRLQLFSECLRLQPDTVFDPLAIDDVLDEHDIHDFRAWSTLEPARRMELARRASQMSPQSGLGARHNVA